MSWTTTQINDPQRQIAVAVPVPSGADTVTDGTETAALANVIDSLDISTGYEDAYTDVDAGDITAIDGFRTIAFSAVDYDAGYTEVLEVDVEITGETLFSRRVKEVIRLDGDTPFKVSKYAYTGKPTIRIRTRGADTSDVLEAATCGVGIPVWSKTLQSVMVLGQNGYANDLVAWAEGTDYEWDGLYSVLTPVAKGIDNSVIYVSAFQDKTIDPSGIWAPVTH